MTTAERLKTIMAERKLKQIDIIRLCQPLCKKYGERLERNDLSQYISGRNRPRQNKLTILGEGLGVSEAWLMGYDVPRERPGDDEAIPSSYDPLPKMKRVPLLGGIACGKPILAVEDHDEDVEMPADVVADFALTCHGDSMKDRNWRVRSYFPLLERLGIPKLNPHKARHTFATLAANAGADPATLQKFLGHADFSTTANIYHHADLSALQKVADLIP